VLHPRHVKSGCTAGQGRGHAFFCASEATRCCSTASLGVDGRGRDQAARYRRPKDRTHASVRRTSLGDTMRCGGCAANSKTYNPAHNAATRETAPYKPRHWKVWRSPRPALRSTGPGQTEVDYAVNTSTEAARACRTDRRPSCSPLHRPETWRALRFQLTVPA